MRRVIEATQNAAELNDESEIGRDADYKIVRKNRFEANDYCLLFNKDNKYKKS